MRKSLPLLDPLQPLTNTKPAQLGFREPKRHITFPMGDFVAARDRQVARIDQICALLFNREYRLFLEATPIDVNSQNSTILGDSYLFLLLRTTTRSGTNEQPGAL